MRILFFGSSIAQGFWDPEGGWVQRIRRHYDTKQLENWSQSQPLIFNLGVSGDTSTNVCQRFIAETTARQWPGEELVFVIAIGVNDACIDHGKPKGNPVLYAENVTEIIAMARQFSFKILFVGLTPCDEDKTVPVAWGDYTYKNQDIRQLNEILEKVCTQQNIPLVAIFDAFEPHKKELLPDGLHPNAEGHKLIASLVLPELEKLLA